MSSAPSHADTLVSDIMEYVSRAEELLAARDTLSLVALNNMVDTLCERILNLDPNQADRHADALQGVMTHLAGLQSRMVTMQGEVSQAIKQVNQSQKANRAYITAPEA